MGRLDRRQLRIRSVQERYSSLNINKIAISPEQQPPALTERQQTKLALIIERIRTARNNGRPVMLTYGAHLIKNGLGPVLIRLMEDGWVTHLATNGAGSIHDWEFAALGVSSEDVRANVARGEFGTWEETGKAINLAIAVGGLDNLGYGWSVGKLIHEDGLTISTQEFLRERLCMLAAQPSEELGAVADMISLVATFGLPAGHMEIVHPHKSYSVQAAAYRLGVPLTIHPGIGYDIIYTHPLNCGGAIGRAAVRDFLTFAGSVSQLAGGVHLSVGSAIMAPMVFEKSMSMANNLALQGGEAITDHFLAVNDIQDGGDWDWKQGEPPKDHPAYYLRFCKSFYRMGGELAYICLDNRAFLLRLSQALCGKAPISVGSAR